MRTFVIAHEYPRPTKRAAVASPHDIARVVWIGSAGALLDHLGASYVAPFVVAPCVSDSSGRRSGLGESPGAACDHQVQPGSDGVTEWHHSDLAMPIRFGSRSRVRVTRAQVTTMAHAAGAAP
jgi:hypothetical protein